jgi:hypothetical protein
MKVTDNNYPPLKIYKEKMKYKSPLIIAALITLNLAACDNKQPEELTKAVSA